MFNVEREFVVLSVSPRWALRTIAAVERRRAADRQAVIKHISGTSGGRIGWI